MKCGYRISVGKLKERYTRKRRHRQEDNIKTDLREIEWKDVDDIQVV
jgi:hypothetical protein